MVIEDIQKVEAREIPETPQDVIAYLTMDDAARADFNAHNLGYWQKHNIGFFSKVRSVLGHNQSWIDLLGEELKKIEHQANVAAIRAKMATFYENQYVGPMIGSLPYFARWAEPEAVKEGGWKE